MLGTKFEQQRGTGKMLNGNDTCFRTQSPQNDEVSSRRHRSNFLLDVLSPQSDKYDIIRNFRKLKLEEDRRVEAALRAASPSFSERAAP